jgi:hypothetical protein
MPKPTTAAPESVADLTLPELASQVARARIKTHGVVVEHFRNRRHDDHAAWSRFEMALDELLRVFPW